MRKKRNPPQLPKPGDTKQTQWLPRDVKMGWSPSDSKGKLFYGFCETTETWQLWTIISQGKEGMAEFLGFVDNPN